MTTLFSFVGLALVIATIFSGRLLLRVALAAVAVYIGYKKDDSLIRFLYGVLLGLVFADTLRRFADG